MKLICLFAASMLFISLTGCSNKSNKPKADPSIPPKYTVTKDPVFKYQGDLQFISNGNTLSEIKIEIADTDKKRETGLMYRHSMKENHGMLFLMEREERQSFWMKNTHIALDIIYVNAEKRIVHIAHDCAPYSLKSIPSYEYALYVVEVNGGYCKKHDIKEGNYIEFTTK